MKTIDLLTIIVIAANVIFSIMSANWVACFGWASSFCFFMALLESKEQK